MCENKRKLCINIKCEICFERSFSSFDSKKVDCWSKKNLISPRSVYKSSRTIVLFDCDKCNHEFEKSLDKVTGKRLDWCSYCTNKKLCNNNDCIKCFNNSFSSFFDQKKLSCWSTTNKESPREIFKYSHKKIFFKCDECKHEFGNKLKNISNKNKLHWCSYCSNKNLCNNDECKICFDKSFESFENKKKLSCFNFAKNKIIPRNLFKGSDKIYFFNCDKCYHEFEISLTGVTNKNQPRWCPYCSNQKLCDDDNCIICFNKSFASFNSKKLLCWSSKNKETPREIFKGSDKKYFFDCDKCNHEFEGSLNHITCKKNATWCSYCSGKNLCSNDECIMCFNKSFASFDTKKLLCYSKKNEKTPREIFKGSENKIIFDCYKCVHEFTSILYNITGKNHWCPYCSNQKLCDDNNCMTCFNKSFLSFDDKKKLSCWSIKNKINPRDIFKGTTEKYLFDCSECKNEFKSSISHITNKNSLTWCPTCKNKTEKKLLTFLQKYYNNDVKYQPKFDWCKNEDTNKHLPFDFVIEKYNLIIELDGLQHFKQVRNWISPEKNQDRDIYKMNKAKENNYSLIRILQEDVLFNKIKWEELLLKNIKKYDIPTIIPIEKENGKKYKYII